MKSKPRTGSAAIPAALLTLVLALSASGCGGAGDDAHGDGGAEANSTVAEDGREEEAIPVEVGPVRLEPISALYSTSATLRADKRATVTARTRGVVERIVVEEGDTVQEGQPLAYLEDDEQKIAFERARKTHETREREYSRSKSLHAQGLVSDEEFETLRREAEDAEQAFALAALNLSRTVIRSPFTGLVVARHLDVGANVSDGSEIFDVADLDPLYADVNVPERHVAQLSPGKAVRLSIDASGDTVDASIERIAPTVEPTTGTVKVTVAVPVSSSLRPGSFARIDIVTDTHTDALVVPRPALVAEGNRWHLFRLDEAQEKAERLEVRLGFEEGERVEILELVDAARLQPGQSVVVVGAPALTDGAHVKVMEPPGENEAGSEDGGVHP